MENKNYTIPNPILDTKEKRRLETLTEEYNKMLEPTRLTSAISSVGKKIPPAVKQKAVLAKNTVSEKELFIKCLEVLGKSFQTLEEIAAKVAVSEKRTLKQLNKISSEITISSLDEVCLLRGYDIAKLVNSGKNADIFFSLVEGAGTGAFGFSGIPFNLLLSTFLYYRVVQSIAMYYGYDVKNEPEELRIASEVFMNALSPTSNYNSELSNSIAKIMLISTAASVKQTVNKGWTKMAEKGGVHLLLTQMRALAHKSAQKALENAGKKSLENIMFKEVFEQIGRKLTQKAITRSIPCVSAVIGATLDSAQMVKIIKYANIFYNKRFLLEKEYRINELLGVSTDDTEYTEYEETFNDTDNNDCENLTTDIGETA